MVQARSQGVPGVPVVCALLAWLALGCAAPVQGDESLTDTDPVSDVADTTDAVVPDVPDTVVDVLADAVDVPDATDLSDLTDTADGEDVTTDTVEPDAQPDVTPTCLPEEKHCAHTFSYAGTGSETTVQVAGSWNNWKGVEMTLGDGGLWSVALTLPQNLALHYKFVVDGTWKPDPSNPETRVDDGYGGKNSVVDPLSCPDDGTCPPPTTVCGIPAKTDAFDWRNGVMYFVFVDRFFNGDPSNDQKNATEGLPEISNWYGGDWKGVTQKIQEGWFTDLGVNVLWLTVPMDTTDAAEFGEDGKLYTAYHGYWPRDVDKPEARFGTMADLQALVATAHGKGIQVVLDYAMNHVHKDSPVFQQHPDWFFKLNGGGGDCICGSNVCPWDGPSGIWCWFRDYLPDFDFSKADARKASIDNVMWWMKQSGADGLRLDAIKHIDGSWLTDLRKRLNEELEPERAQHIWLVGETYTGDKGLIKSFVDPCAKLDGQFDFPLRAVLDEVLLLRTGKLGDLEKFMNENDSFYGPNALMSTFAGNHDLPRMIHYATDPPLFGSVWDAGKGSAWNNPPGIVQEEAAYERLVVAMAVLMTNRGVPMIYYGDEVGLPGAGDPDNRRPMQWSGWTDPQKNLLDQMRKLGKIRKEHKALRLGTRTTEWVGADAWVYRMVSGDETVYVALNRSDAVVEASGLPATGTWQDALTAESVAGPTAALAPRSVRILTSKP